MVISPQLAAAQGMSYRQKYKPHGDQAPELVHRTKSEATSQLDKAEQLERPRVQPQPVQTSSRPRNPASQQYTIRKGNGDKIYIDKSATGKASTATNRALARTIDASTARPFRTQWGRNQTCEISRSPSPSSASLSDEDRPR
jgi:hypothetical protein